MDFHFRFAVLWFYVIFDKQCWPSYIHESAHDLNFKPEADLIVSVAIPRYFVKTKAEKAEGMPDVSALVFSR